MTRVSKLSTDEEFAIEERREKFRDRRSKRYCKLILTFAFALTVLSSTTSPLHALLLGLP